MRNNFNASVSEIANDKWQRGQIGVSIVSNDSRFLDSQLRKIMNFVEGGMKLIIMIVLY